MTSKSNGVVNLLFPTPVFTFDLKNHNKNKKKYVPLILDNYEKNKNQKAKWSYLDHTWTTFNSVDLIDIQIKEETNFFLKYLLQHKPNFKVDFFSWINVHDSNMYMGEHEHHGSLLSGIYYLKFNNKKHVPVTFLNPLNKEIAAWQAYNYDQINTSNKFLHHNSSPLKMNIKEGTVVLFPSYLTHFVPRSICNDDELRISYTFNINLKNFYDEMQRIYIKHGYIDMKCK